MVATFTPNYEIPLPDPEADVDEEFLRLQQAWSIVDAVIWTLAGVVANKANVSHTQAMSTVTGLVEALAAKMPASQTFSLDSLTDVDGAAGAATNYVLVKTASGVWSPSSAAAAIGNHQHGTGDIVGLTAAISAVVNAVIGAAPGALDTLDELAAALGDDPNFATTITNLIASNGVQPTVNAATAKTALADADVMPLLDSAASNGLKKVTLANLITSIFNGTRKIANGWFNADTFRLYKAATAFYSWFDAVALTAIRKIVLPDRDITLGITKIFEAVISGAATDFDIPPGIRRFVLRLQAYSTNGTSVPMVQMRGGGVVETSGYSGGANNSAGTTFLANTTGAFLNIGNAASTTYDVEIEFTWLTGNAWAFKISGTNGGATVDGYGIKTLSATFDGIRIRAANGTDVADNGLAYGFVEY
ncbi:Hypothetical protein NGAL_HAMBI1146_58740 [Neorhizobium galegae bv. officinalis]|nr:Hypothetical protein NGAL_HAMBI1146_58740 [Neorhizobium galegae bv. officinalis]